MVCLVGILFGLPDTTIKESKERIRTAVKNCGIELLSKKYIINLSPANIKKDGPNFDLAIAVGILSSINLLKQKRFEDTVFVGELSLDGKINKINGVLPICVECKKNLIKRVILPKENSREGALVDGIEVIGVNNLIEVIKYLSGELDLKKEKVDNNEVTFKNNAEYDFSEVKGNKSVKRALEIAAAGAHNCLMIGSPRMWKNNACKKISKYSARNYI